MYTIYDFVECFARGCIPLRRGLEDAPGVRPYWVNKSLVVGSLVNCSLVDDYISKTISSGGVVWAG
jgi:hypothetical protein